MESGDRFGGVAQAIDLLEGIECIINRLTPETRTPGPPGNVVLGPSGYVTTPSA
jgi:hypothetical protein